jgi:RNA-binding protein YlmH
MRADASAARRLTELAARAARTGLPQVTHFLTPAEMAQADICARAAGVALLREGGASAAERQMAAFADEDAAPAFPIACVTLTWAERFGDIGHRDVLGAVLALGVDRERLGDILIKPGTAYLFAEEAMAAYIAERLTEVGRVRVSAAVGAPPVIEASPVGSEVRGTVASLRLDALLALAFRASRGRAAEWVSQGRVQVDHLPELRPDRAIAEGAMLSVRGLGRAQLTEIGGKTKKERIGVKLSRF